MAHNLILASASSVRRSLLENVGLNFEIQPAHIDERAVQQAFEDENAKEGQIADPGDIAQILAVTKAQSVSAEHEGYVIGADQVLALDNRLFEKPKTLEEAQDTLFLLRGKTHTLYSSVCVASGGEVKWHYADQAHMKMRTFSPEFVGRYLALCGERVCDSVGAYQLEGPGLQLFSEIRGDYFTILGLPMLPLLAYLRQAELIDG